ncbi:hypothetical protein KF728_21570 [Candidatus Obscuribacterales bacterium]|nr:hypothetical protein [Candidatus Obscuribacterales bacterium]
MTSTTSSPARADFDAVDHDLNVARAKNKLGDGTAADRELEEIKKKAGAKSLLCRRTPRSLNSARRRPAPELIRA